MQIVTKKHYQLLLQGVADARANADAQVRQKDEVISDLRGLVAKLDIERKELLDIVLYRERQYMQPSAQATPPQGDFDSWASILKQQIDEISQTETATE